MDKNTIFYVLEPFLGNFDHSLAILAILEQFNNISSFLTTWTLKNTSKLFYNLFYSSFNRKKKHFQTFFDLFLK